MSASPRAGETCNGLEGQETADPVETRLLSGGLDPISRRRFLALLSASAALGTGVSCSTVDRGLIVPYTRRPADVVPGKANYYASAFQEGVVAHGVLVKTREGRPIHIEGNPDHPNSQGKTSLRAMGDLLGLYDPDRLRAPVHRGSPSSWDDAVKALARVFTDARMMDRPVLLVTGALVSPTQRALISDLMLALPGLRHAAWEPAAAESEMRSAQALYGRDARDARDTILRYHFERADVVLALQSDFLGVDARAPEFARGFAARRTGVMNRLWVLEGSMTLTGANADARAAVRPSALAPIAFSLIRLLHEQHSTPLPAGLTGDDLAPFDPDRISSAAGMEPALLRSLAKDLAHSRTSALVIAGPAVSAEAQLASRLLNSMLGQGYTVDIDVSAPSVQLTTMVELRDLLREAARGDYAVGIFWGANPAYAFPDAGLWKRAVAAIPETFRIGLYEDETALDCVWRLPENHWLESWGDFQTASDFVALRQPTMGTMHDSRQAEEFFLAVLRRMKIRAPASYLEYLKSRWRADVYGPGRPVSFGVFWNAALHDGGARIEPEVKPSPEMNAAAIGKGIASAARWGRSAAKPELVLSPAAAVYDGRYANNGWLNELPDPVAKTTWGNPLLISVADAQRLGVEDGDLVRISHGDRSLQAPAAVQPGQAGGVVSLSLGYGRRLGSVARGVGVNAYPLLDLSSGSPFLVSGVEIARVGRGSQAIMRTQGAHRMEGRDLARSWTRAAQSLKARPGERDAHDAHGAHDASLIADREYRGQKWGMAVDLSACTGCSACVIACQSENNVPVVGPEQVEVRREMHWIRIDRYYEGDLRSPSVVHQPMLCQQCDKAPCEIVCPVNATTHSPDGLNQMAYNRCVGTRYCSNNCPFKVRRFNFFDYTSMKKPPESLAYNPEVTVRPRGVMEKCTFCVQRIQNVRQNARRESRNVKDGEIQPACAAACPSDAIVFGDTNDPESRVSRLSRDQRSYRLLAELGIKPSVFYLAHISNPPDAREDKA